MRSVTVGTSTSAVCTASGKLGVRHRLVVGIEAGVEKFPHAQLDAVGQLAGDDDQRLFGLRHVLLPRRPAAHRTTVWAPFSPL